jgi:hypothetical protein
LRPAVARQLIDTIKGGTLVFAYFPDRQWLEGSAFVGGCGTGSNRRAEALPHVPAAYRAVNARM